MEAEITARKKVKIDGSEDRPNPIAHVEDGLLAPSLSWSLTVYMALDTV